MYLNNINNQKIWSRLIYSLLCIFIYNTSLAQYQDRQWFIDAAPRPVILDFNFDTLTIKNKRAQLDPPTIFPSNICDTNGKLQFITNEYNIYDSTINTIVQNNTEIDDYSAPLSGGGMMFLDFPNSEKVVCIRSRFEEMHVVPYYFLQTKFYLSYIDRYANGGRGALIEDKKLLTIVDDTLNMPVGACRHANGRDWWLLMRKFRSNKFFIALVTPNGYSVKEQIIGDPLPLIYGEGGKAMFSNDGKTFVFGTSLGNSFTIAPWHFEVFDFDRCSGTLSNQRKCTITDIYNARVQGVAISPNNRYLYVSMTTKLFQYDLWASNLDSSRIYIDTSASDAFMGDIKLAPNGKMYISALWVYQYLSTIEYPDSAGLACGYRRNSIDLGNPDVNNYYFPNLPCFTLGRDSTVFGCDTLSTVGIETNLLPDKYTISVYPNPSEDIVYIQSSSMISSYEIIDMKGKLLEKNNHLSDQYELNIQHYTSGIYIIKLYIGDEVVVRKIIKK
jgi:hypothetical protein